MQPDQHAPDDLSGAAAQRPASDGWRPVDEAPEYRWLWTWREGEEKPSIASVRYWPDGGQEWMAPDGRTTVTHGTYAAPTHFCLPPAPSGATASLPEPGADGEVERLKQAVDDQAQAIRQEREEVGFLREALRGMLHEWDKFTRYGSPIAKQANENVNRARAALNGADR